MQESILNIELLEYPFGHKGKRKNNSNCGWFNYWINSNCGGFNHWTECLIIIQTFLLVKAFATNRALKRSIVLSAFLFYAKNPSFDVHGGMFEDKSPCAILDESIVFF